MTDPYPTPESARGPELRLLSREDVELVLEAALSRLSGGGLVPASDEARRALLAAGATEAGGEALRLAGEITEAAAARAPRRVVLGPRSGESEVVLEPGSGVLAAAGRPAGQLQPLDESPSRAATESDLADACRLADALPEVSVVAGPPLATNPTGDGRGMPAEVAAALRATTMHLVLTGGTTHAATAACVEVALALSGDEAAMRRRPPLSLLGGAESFAAAAEFARRGLPAGALVSAVAPASAVAPVAAALGEPSPAGVTEALVAYLADVFAANAALQAVAPGAAYIAPVWPALAGLPLAGPGATAFMVAATQVLTRAGLPAAAAAFATSAPTVDWQACTEGSFAVLSCLLAGAALVTGAGTLSNGTVFSPSQLVADSEIFSWCRAIAAGIPVDDETLAVEAIRQVDICGNFLGQKHTRRHMKDVWRPRLLDRAPWDAWVAGGRHGASEKASELAGSLLAGHAVEPLDSETVATLERIIATAGL